jgi:hypothetical protein
VKLCALCIPNTARDHYFNATLVEARSSKPFSTFMSITLVAVAVAVAVAVEEWFGVEPQRVFFHN